MKKIFLSAIFAVSISFSFAQLSLNGFNTPVNVDFNSWAGTGFTPSPAAGQLSSNAWSIFGMSDGNLIFGGTRTTGDFARGLTFGHVTTGGFYSMDRGGGNHAMWIQPAGFDFNPGALSLLCTNNTGSAITDLNVSFLVLNLNDQARSTSVKFTYSTDSSNYPDTLLALITPTTSDDSLYTVTVNFSLTGLNLNAGGFIVLQWVSRDVSGSGARDEIGLDDIVITAPQGCNPPTGLSASNASSSSIHLSWNAAAGATKYKIQYRPQGTATWLSKNAMNTSKVLNGLNALTVYQYRIRTICGTTNSMYSPVSLFTTTQPRMAAETSLGINVYPNPGDGIFTIEVSGTNDNAITVSATDILGREVFHSQLMNATDHSVSIVDLRAMPSGVYFLSVKEGDRSVTKQMMKIN